MKKFLAVALIVIAIYGFSWLSTCGLIKLVTLCFGLTFDWRIATGIWILMCIARSIFSSKN